MASSKLKAPPTLTTVIVLGILSLALGKILAMASLATQSVNEVQTMPEEDEIKPGVVYYIKGSESRSAGWEVKRQALLSGSNQVVAFSENELNQWSKKELNPSNAEMDEESAASFLSLIVSTPNFRITEDQLQISTYVEIPSLMPGSKYLVVVKGHFETTASGVDFIIDSGTIGRAPFGSIPIIRGILFNLFQKQFKKAEDYNLLIESVAGIEEIVIENGRLGFVGS